MGGTHNPRRIVQIQAYVSLGEARWRPGVQPHADTHDDGFWPSIGGEGALGCACGTQGITGTRKHRKQRIALGIDLVTVMGMEGGAQQLATRR
jgi:hypothetical protein